MKYLALVIALAACDDDTTLAPDARLPIDAPASCDTIAQDCPEGFKCSVTGTAHQCFPVLGTLGEASPCTHTGLNDDCAPGLACSASGTCRSLCTGTDSCTAGQRCIHFRAGDGLCEQPCTLLDSTMCPAAFSCDLGFEQGANLATYCRRFDTTPLGAPCIPDVNCGENASCGSPDGLVCSQLCDANHACSTGACQHPVADFPELGVCF